MTEKIFALVIVLVGTVVLITLLMALPVMWLWNWLMPELFGMTTITFWQALGISMLSSLLFKSYNTSNNSKS